MAVKDLFLSARIAGRVMNYPLYDGDVSEKARQSIASGNLIVALDEYRRLADLGSGRARCILAYLYLRDVPSMPRDLSASRKLADSAIPSEPGYAKYVLSIAALYAKEWDRSVKLMQESDVAEFPPAASAMGLIFRQGVTVPQNPALAEKMFLRAIALGHIPAEVLMCRLYMDGSRGFAKRAVGWIAFPFLWLRLWVLTRFLIFSIRTFRHFNITQPPMFNQMAATRRR